MLRHPKMIQEAYDELDAGRINVAEELIQRLRKYPDEYKGHVRTAGYPPLDNICYSCFRNSLSK
jgi:hypothetical protein